MAKVEGCPLSSRWLSWVLVTCLFLCGCSLPQVTAESRTFLNLELEFLGNAELPQATFDGTTVGGISALTYGRDRIYALSDDRQRPRFYTLALKLNAADQLETITVEAVTLLKDQRNQPIAPQILDPEGMGLTPQDQVWISSEGVHTKSPPLIAAFDLATGTWQDQLQLPGHFLPALKTEGAEAPQGIADNRGFEALALSPQGDRVFTATELPLIQDFSPDESNPERYSRLLHYLLVDVRPLLIAEYLYPLEPPTLGINGLTELLSIDSGGHFLALERSFSPLSGFNAQIFQITAAGATDTSDLERLETPLQGVNPMLKQPLLNLRDLNLTLSNLEGMTLGPTLSDGSSSLLVVSDNGFAAEQPTQFLLFRLRQNAQSTAAESR